MNRSIDPNAETTKQRQARWLALGNRAEADYARWLASIPSTLDPVMGQAAADRALQYSRSIVRDVALSYGGTIPPPPWPATQEVMDAQQKMRTFSRGFGVLQKHTPGARWPRDAGKMGPALKRHGRALYAATGAMLKGRAKNPMLSDLIPSLPEFGALAVIGLAVWFFKGELFDAAFRSARRRSSSRRLA